MHLTCPKCVSGIFLWQTCGFPSPWNGERLSYQSISKNWWPATEPNMKVLLVNNFQYLEQIFNSWSEHNPWLEVPPYPRSNCCPCGCGCFILRLGTPSPTHVACWPQLSYFTWSLKRADSPAFARLSRSWQWMDVFASEIRKPKDHSLAPSTVARKGNGGLLGQRDNWIISSNLWWVSATA